MSIRHLSFPGCMAPDGAPPCSAYAELYEYIQKMESALHEIIGVHIASHEDAYIMRDIAEDALTKIEHKE